MIGAVATSAKRSKRSWIAAVLGVLSVALLGASVQWAHHWGPLADSIVAAWVVATLGSLVVSAVLLRQNTLWLMTYAARRLAKIGLAGGLVSVAALTLAGVAFAAGLNVSGACGGG